MDIPIYYDPMIAKLITFGSDRQDAIQKMIRAIDEYQITGVATTLPFCAFVMKHEAFISGNFDTHFVSKYFKPEMLQNKNEEEESIAAFAAAYLWDSNAKENTSVQGNHEHKKVSLWKKNRINFS